MPDTSERERTPGRHSPAALAVAFAALFAALTGAAAALPGRNTVDSGDIINREVKAGDLGKQAVKPAKLARRAVRSRHIKDGGIALRDIRESTRNALRGRSGAVTLDQAAFAPLRSTTDHEFDPAGGRLCSSGFPWFEAVFVGLPDGATLSGFEFFGFDSSSDENLIGFVKRTTPQASGGPLLTVLATFASFGSGGFQTVSDPVDPGDAEIDGASTYSVSVRLDGQESASCSEGEDLRVVGTRASWARG